MSTEQTRIQLSEEMGAILEEAIHQPLLAEVKGTVYRIFAEKVLPPSPFTFDSVYGSLPPLNGRPGSEVSNEELEETIEAGKRANLADIFDGMRESE